MPHAQISWLTHRTFRAMLNEASSTPQRAQRTGRLHLLHRDDRADSTNDGGRGDDTTWAHLAVEGCDGGGYVLSLLPMDRDPAHTVVLAAAWTTIPTEDTIRRGLAMFLEKHEAELQPNPLADPQW